ncbi:unnamed protein product [Symbiodinium sp. CCMP2592]|nr:unnamed protein product [Symbiodinium sp. CCMP2592]
MASDAQISLEPHTWAFMLSTAAVVSEDLEGLFFGPAPGHVCSFRLVGRSGSSTDKATAVLSERAQELVAEQMRHGFRLLGWCNLRGPSSTASTLTPEEARLHQALKTASDALSGPDAAFAGCLIQRAAREKDIFQQVAVAFGPSKKRIPITVRHFSARAPPAAEPVTGQLQEVMAACAADLREDLADLDKVVERALVETEEKFEMEVLPQVKRLRTAQHNAESVQSTQRA